MRQPQGAGAAFSAGLIHRLRRGDDLEELLRFACAAGSRWCSRPFGAPLPNEAEIDVFADRAPTNLR
ncbi:PfkB family carbohydrate kinase [Actinomadura darangshiensis]